MIDAACASGSESSVGAPDVKACASPATTFPIFPPPSHRAAVTAPSSTLRYVMPVCFFFGKWVTIQLQKRVNSVM